MVKDKMIPTCFCYADLLIVLCFDNNWCIFGFSIWKWSYKEIHGTIFLWNAFFHWFEDIQRMRTGFDKAVDFLLSRMDLMVMPRQGNLSKYFWNLSFSTWKRVFWHFYKCIWRRFFIFQHRYGFFGKYLLKKKNLSPVAKLTEHAC